MFCKWFILLSHLTALSVLRDRELFVWPLLARKLWFRYCHCRRLPLGIILNQFIPSHTLSTRFTINVTMLRTRSDKENEQQCCGVLTLMAATSTCRVCLKHKDTAFF
jgi:hypothetical protein